MDYETRTLSILVAPKDQPTFSEYATEIKIVDEEAAGEFLEVSQTGRTDLGKIAINPEEWPTLRDAIDRMVKECR
jgi:hypothetical protein